VRASSVARSTGGSDSLVWSCMIDCDDVRCSGVRSYAYYYFSVRFYARGSTEPMGMKGRGREGVECHSAKKSLYGAHSQRSSRLWSKEGFVVRVRI
jgi:hypothetical protein